MEVDNYIIQNPTDEQLDELDNLDNLEDSDCVNESDCVIKYLQY